MNLYDEMKERHQAEHNAFPMVFAFSQSAFEEGLEKLGLKSTDVDQVCTLFGAGDIVRKADVSRYVDMLTRHQKEREEAIKADKTGYGFILDMFASELSNHEFGYTEDANDTLDALGISWEDLNNNPCLNRGFKRACKRYQNR